MDFDITVRTVDPADHKRPPNITAKIKIIKRLRSDAKKLAAGKEVKRTMKYVDSARCLDIAIYYGVERIAPTAPDQYFSISCNRSQIVEAIETFIEKQLNTDIHDTAISNTLKLFQKRTSGALDKARRTRLPSVHN